MSGYELEFYKDEKGRSPTFEFLETLASGNKREKGLLEAVYRKLKRLTVTGTRDGMPDFRSIGGKHALWEIRVKHSLGYYRIFIAQCPWNKRCFIILNCFRKDEKKTPKSEIERAERLMNDYVSRKKG